MSTFLERRLPPDEAVEYRGRPSRIYAFRRAVLWLIVFLVSFIVFSNRASNDPTYSDQNAPISPFEVVLVLIILFSLVALVITTIRGFIFLKNSEYLVTDRRVVGKYGFGRIQSVDVMMTNIAGVTVYQSITGRLFGFGHVWVEGSGSRRQLVGISNPTKFQQAVYKRLDESRLLKGTAAYTLDVRMAPPDPNTLATAAPVPMPPPTTPPATQAPATRRFCSQCGGNLEGAARFCEHCGAAVPA